MFFFLDFAEIISLDAFNKSTKSNEFVIGITIIKVHFFLILKDKHMKRAIAKLFSTFFDKILFHKILFYIQL